MTTTGLRGVGTSVVCVLGLATSLAGASAAAAATAGPAGAQSLSRSPVQASSAWKRYVVDPGALVYPKRVEVIGAASAVSDPSGLKAAGGAVTTISATGAGAPRLVLDLGANTGGHVEVGITRTDGTAVRLGYSELSRFLTPAGDNCACGDLGLSVGGDDNPDARTDVIAPSGVQSWRSPGIRGGERYVSVQLEGAGTVSIDYVRVRVTHLRAPVSAYAGHFLSSDRLLNRAWYASAYTFAMNSLRDLRPAYRSSSRTVVTDGAKRDRLIWAGDLAIENLLGTYSLRAAPGIIKNSLSAFSCQQMANGELPPLLMIATRCPQDAPSQPGAGGSAWPEYTAWWIVGLRDYYLYTGDRRFARQMMPVVRRALGYFAGHTRNGVYTTAGLNWHPPDPGDGEDAHTNATLFRALRGAADLERWVGRGKGAARVYGRRSSSLRRAMIARLWDAQAGAFVVNRSDPRRNHTQDAQVEAVYAGVTNRSQSRRALRFITSQLLRPLGVANGQYDDDPYMSNYISPFISSTELLARLRYRDTHGALRLIRRTWGHMLTTGPGTLWEKVGFDGLPANYEPLQAPVDFFSGANLAAGWVSLAHGWGGGPVPALSGYVLGIRPTAPGYRTWVVAPQPGDLRFAQGQAPTPRGAIVSRWTRGKGRRSFKLTVDAPRGTSGAVTVPLLGRRRAIAMDGRIVWTGRHALGGARARRAGGAVTFRGIRGRHTFAWTAR